MRKCLVCFDELPDTLRGEYHPQCSKRLFGSANAPALDLDSEKLMELGLSILKAGQGLPGVQKKLSMDFEDASRKRLTIVGYKGSFILKPQAEEYGYLPENEAFCMELARRLEIPVAEHGLMRNAAGTLAYVSRRFDRLESGGKRHQEDFCQIALRPSSDKYKGSLEAAAKALRFSRQPGLDAVRFLELNLFCWLSGNADMHLKNFLLLNASPGRWELSPAYDLLSTALAIPADREETALTLNGKKSNLSQKDWMTLSAALDVNEKAARSSIARLAESTEIAERLCRRSFMPGERQKAFIETWKKRAAHLG
jgi:serine/threonine-protein kinase HipA